LKITIESTDRITKFNGAEVRVWNGTTEQGTPCLVFVKAIAALAACDTSELDRQLESVPEPSEARVIPLRNIL